MFGDKPIVGCELRTIDSKGRMCIPAFTWVELHEQDLCITKISPVEGVVCLMVQKSTKLRERIAELEALKAEVESATEKANIQQQLVNLCLNTSTLDASVDGQRRMLIPAKLRDEMFNRHTDIVCQGAYDSVLIFPSTEMYEQFNHKR